MRHVIVLAAAAVLSFAAAQGRAWRDLTFGMSEAEVTQLLDSYTDVDQERRRPFEVVDLAGGKFIIGRRYLDGGLALLSFRSLGEPATYFDTVVMRHQQRLVGILRAAYGEPSVVREVGFMDLSPGRVYTHVWGADEDGVVRKVGLYREGSSYGAVLVVEHQRMMAELEAREAAERAAEDAEDAQDF